MTRTGGWQQMAGSADHNQGRGHSESAADPVLPADEGLRRLLGEVCWLILHSPLHRALSMESIERLFLVPAELDQLRIYRRGPRPVGLVTWAWLSPEAEAAHLAGERALAPDEWRSGAQLWYPDFIAPFGDLPAIVRDARRIIPPGGTGLGARRGPDGSIRRVLKLYPVGDRPPNR